MAKTIIFSFDGTGNEVSDAKKFAVDTSISNVLNYILSRAVGLMEVNRNLPPRRETSK